MSNVVRALTRSVLALVAAAAMTVVADVACVPSAQASISPPRLSTFDARLLADINHARTSRGIRALTVVAGTTDVAHSWSCHMASAVRLTHNLRLATVLETHGSRLWTTYGENVGMVSSASGADTMFRTYMNSPMHRANILDRSFRYLGIWTKTSGSRRWNTLDFVGSTSSSYSYAYGNTRVGC